MGQRSAELCKNSDYTSRCANERILKSLQSIMGVGKRCEKNSRQNIMFDAAVVDCCLVFFCVSRFLFHHEKINNCIVPIRRLNEKVFFP